MEVVHLKHTEIDKVKWDAAIADAANGLPYALSCYLDVVSPQWEALMADDYMFVMPLPKKRKLGFSYLIQPRFTQQLGLFSAREITPDILRLFVSKIPYIAYHLHLNAHNPDGQQLRRSNYELVLSDSYDTMKAHFSNNTRRNIVEAYANGLHLDSVDSEVFIDFWLEHNPATNSAYKVLLPHFIPMILENHLGQKIGIYTADNELIAVLLLLVYHKRIFYLLPASSTKGKALKAMFFLIDFLIQTHAKSSMILDFEGSMIDGVARFYRGFGAINHPYPYIIKNRPSWLVKLIRR